MLHRILSVELLESILAARFPAENRVDYDSIQGMLVELRHFRIHTDVALIKLLDEHSEDIRAAEAEEVNISESEIAEWSATGAARIRSGVFHTWAGLLRTALRVRYGDAIEPGFFLLFHYARRK